MAPQKSTSRFNPRGGDRRGQRPLGARPASSLWYGLAFLLLLGLAQMYYMTPTGRTVPYSEFKSMIKSGQVAEVTISDQAIRGTLDGIEHLAMYPCKVRLVLFPESVARCANDVGHLEGGPAHRLINLLERFTSSGLETSIASSGLATACR